MPVTRRRRANPPEQPENNNNHLAEQPDHTTVEAAASTEQQNEAATEPDKNAWESASQEHQQATSARPQEEGTAPMAPPFMQNGERGIGQADYNQTIKGGRRTSRGELFRRPPQPPTSIISGQPPVSPTPSLPSQLQPPSHEIKLPLGSKPGDIIGDPLHLAYNPGYTGADEVRSALLRRLAADSKHGGRGRCWSCGSLAVAYECWNTRSKTFGEIGIAYCEICGVWSVM